LYQKRYFRVSDTTAQKPLLIGNYCVAHSGGVYYPVFHSFVFSAPLYSTQQLKTKLVQFIQHSNIQHSYCRLMLRVTTRPVIGWIDYRRHI